MTVFNVCTVCLFCLWHWCFSLSSVCRLTISIELISTDSSSCNFDLKTDYIFPILHLSFPVIRQPVVCNTCMSLPPLRNASEFCHCSLLLLRFHIVCCLVRCLVTFLSFKCLGHIYQLLLLVMHQLESCIVQMAQPFQLFYLCVRTLRYFKFNRQDEWYLIFCQVLQL